MVVEVSVDLLFKQDNRNIPGFLDFAFEHISTKQYLQVIVERERCQKASDRSRVVVWTTSIGRSCTFLELEGMKSSGPDSSLGATEIGYSTLKGTDSGAANRSRIQYGAPLA